MLCMLPLQRTFFQYYLDFYLLGAHLARAPSPGPLRQPRLAWPASALHARAAARYRQRTSTAAGTVAAPALFVGPTGS